MYNDVPVSAKIYIPKCQGYISINLLTFSFFFFFFPVSFHHYYPFLLPLLYIRFLFCSLSPSYFCPPSTTSSLQSKQSSSYSDRDTTEDDSESLEDMDFLSRQKKLQAEAKLALAMAKPMAKMQVEVEKQNRKKSPVADLVSTIIIQ